MGTAWAGPGVRAGAAGAALGALFTLEAWAAVASERDCASVGCVSDLELLLAFTALPQFVLLSRLLLHRAGADRPLGTAFGALGLALVLLRALIVATGDMARIWLLTVPYLALCFAAAAHLLTRSSSRRSRLLLACGLTALALTAFLTPDPSPAPGGPTPPTPRALSAGRPACRAVRPAGGTAARGGPVHGPGRDGRQRARAGFLGTGGFLRVRPGGADLPALPTTAQPVA